MKIRSMTAPSLMPARASAGATPRSTATLRMRSASIPRPSSSTSTMTCSPSRRALRRIVATGGLSSGGALGAGLDAMIHRIAHHVQQRLEQHLDDRLVDMVSSPSIASRTGLPSDSDISRTSRENRWKTPRNGRTRNSSTALCSPPIRWSSLPYSSASAAASALSPSRANIAIWPMAFFVTVNSPVSPTSASTRWASMRSVRDRGSDRMATGSIGPGAGTAAQTAPWLIRWRARC